MNTLKNFGTLLLISATILLWSCKNEKKWKGQAPIKKVSTQTVPIQYQLKKTFVLSNGIYCSNNFDGGRLNGISLTNETLITVLITPENTPINGSPWYAFKLWAESEKQVQLKLTYLQGVRHRYYPKLSHDGIDWNNLDSIYIVPDTSSAANMQFTMKLTVGPDTLWVAAQELITTKKIENWEQKLASKPFVSMAEIGKSREGRSINVLEIGNQSSKKKVMVMARQHPPEVTGWLAMKAFVEAISAENSVAEKFRNEYSIYVVPVANPDGVDNGHWRHNSGGVDLNRDWEDFNQPETAAVKKFMHSKTSDGSKFYFAVDFHSTFQDIFYTINPELKGNMPGLVPKMIEQMAKEIPGYDPNVKPSTKGAAKVTSVSFFFYEFGAESVTFEIGDGTPRDLIKLKGELSAMKIMELMTE